MQREGRQMIQRLIAVTIGALVTFGFLVLWDATDFMDPIPAYAVAALLGAVGALVWPVIVGWWFVRRAKDRREDQIQKEVEKQMADQNRS
jgi:di/tricarboxylate transporter